MKRSPSPRAPSSSPPVEVPSTVAAAPTRAHSLAVARISRFAIAIALLSLSAAASLHAQTTHRFEVSVTEARLDGVPLSPATTLGALTRALGAPSRRESIDGYELALWDSLGIVVRHRGGALHEVSLVLRSQGLVLPGGEVFRDPAEPSGLYTGTVQIGGAPLPTDLAAFAPTGLTCTSPSNNHRCVLGGGLALHVSPGPGRPALVPTRRR